VGLNVIDAKMFSKMFLAGAKNLEHKKEWINELNVFPVPDGDTGTNMCMTIMSAAKEVAAVENLDMMTLAKAVSSGSLRGARGNSGVILSQLFRGFTKVIREYDELNVAILASACDKAVETAYKAVMKPKEGTILTVAKGAAKRANDLAIAGEKDLETFLKEVIKEAEVVLSQTPDMLPVLKQAGVVDSGGQGLMQVLKGAYDAYLGKEIDLTIKEVKSSQGTKVKAEAQTDIDIKYGYCTEFIIMLSRNFNIKTEMDFKEYLESIGDSIVVVADDDVVKVHVHTNDPGLAIQKALKYGALSNLKIDNMRLEHQEKLFREGQLKDEIKDLDLDIKVVLTVYATNTDVYRTDISIFVENMEIILESTFNKEDTVIDVAMKSSGIKVDVATITIKSEKNSASVKVETAEGIEDYLGEKMYLEIVCKNDDKKTELTISADLGKNGKASIALVSNVDKNEDNEYAAETSLNFDIDIEDVITTKGSLNIKSNIKVGNVSIPSISEAETVDANDQEAVAEYMTEAQTNIVELMDKVSKIEGLSDLLDIPEALELPTTPVE